MDMYGPITRDLIGLGCKVCFERSRKTIIHRHFSNKYFQDKHYKLKNELFYCKICKNEHYPKQEFSIYFFGSSTYHLACLDENIKAFECLGIETIPGLTFRRLLGLLKDFKFHNIVRVYINCGLNDIDQKRPLNLIKNDINEIITQIKSQNINNKVIFVGNFCPPKLSQQRNYAINNNINEMNSYFKQINSENFQINMEFFGTRKLPGRPHKYFHWKYWRENKYNGMHLQSKTQMLGLRFIYKKIEEHESLIN